MPVYPIRDTSEFKSTDAGGFEQFMNAVVGAAQGAGQSQETKAKKNQEKLEFYIKLRESGYSEDQAKTKVDSVYRGGFMERILGKHESFNVPPEDVFSKKREKERLESEKLKADTELQQSKAQYYREGGPKRSVIDKMTPNQLQQRLKYLNDVLDMDSENEDAKSERDYINKKIQGISGYASGSSQPDPLEGKIIVNRKTGARMIRRNGQWQPLS